MDREAVFFALHTDPNFRQILQDTYWDKDLEEAARRFAESAEFLEVLDRLRPQRERTILDLGAGNGIAACGFARAGAELVYALEPSPSQYLGAGAIRRLCEGLPVEILEGFGENIPLPDGSVDAVYARQMLHHARDLRGVLKECARVLRPGGLFAACREHVCDDSRQLAVFLKAHPTAQQTEDESAFSLPEYLGAIRGAGLIVDGVLGPWDSIINAFPSVRTPEEFSDYPAVCARRRFPRFASILLRVPGARASIRWRLRRPVPGRLFSFFACKPAQNERDGVR